MVLFCLTRGRLVLGAGRLGGLLIKVVLVDVLGVSRAVFISVRGRRAGVDGIQARVVDLFVRRCLVVHLFVLTILVVIVLFSVLRFVLFVLFLVLLFILFFTLVVQLLVG